MYWKFRTKKSGSRIIRIIPTVAILTVLILVVMLWFLLSAVRSKGFHKIGSFSAWLKNITVTTATTIGTLLAVGIYVHFPTHLCKQCRRAVVVRRAPHQQLPSARQSEGIEQQPAHPPEHNNPPESRFNNLHSPVTTDHKPAPLILYPPDVTHRYDSKPSHTRYSNPHSPVTIDCEVLHWFSISQNQTISMILAMQSITFPIQPSMQIATLFHWALTFHIRNITTILVTQGLAMYIHQSLQRLLHWWVIAMIQVTHGIAFLMNRLLQTHNWWQTDNYVTCVQKISCCFFCIV